MAGITSGWLLTVDEVAEILRWHPTTVRRHIASGELPAKRVGSQWRIRSDELDFYIDSTPPRQERRCMTDNLKVRPEGGEHPFIRLLDHGYGGVCFVCGGRFDGDKPVDGGTFAGRDFVELKVQGDSPVTPGALISQHDEQGRTVRMHRDPFSGMASPVTEMHPVICTVCLQAAHRAASLGDTTEIWQERTRERQRADTAERKLAEVTAELAEVKEGLRLARPLLKVLQAEQGTDRPPKRAAKPTAKEAA